MVSENVLKEIVAFLSDRSGERVQIVRTTPVGGGCIHHATKVDTTSGQYFLKWNDRCADDLFEREAESLHELKNAGTENLVIPEVIHAGRAGEVPGFILLEYLKPGHTRSEEEKLGRGLAQLHRYAAKSFGFYHDNYCGSTLQENAWCEKWADFFARQRIGRIVAQISDKRPLTSEQLKIFSRLVHKIPEILPITASPALIHGDLWSGNYMMTERGPALIDPASYYADREMEMGIMTMFGGFSGNFWAAYNEVYPLDPEWRYRNRLYQLYHILNHYLLFGGSYLLSAIDTAMYFTGKK